MADRHQRLVLQISELEQLEIDLGDAIEDLPHEHTGNLRLQQRMVRRQLKHSKNRLKTYTPRGKKARSYGHR